MVFDKRVDPIVSRGESLPLIFRFPKSLTHLTTSCSHQFLLYRDICPTSELHLKQTRPPTSHDPDGPPNWLGVSN